MAGHTSLCGECFRDLRKRSRDQCVVVTVIGVGNEAAAWCRRCVRCKPSAINLMLDVVSVVAERHFELVLLKRREGHFSSPRSSRSQASRTRRAVR